MLFMDDTRIKNFTSCFKEKKFLEFFFKRVKFNDTGRYQEEFPYVSPCGREKNYIRCDDLPIVFTHFLTKDSIEHLSYGYTDNLLTVKFEPGKLCMFPLSGRVYHPGPQKVGGVGLIKSALAIEISPYFRFSPEDPDHQNCPTHFDWKGTTYSLSNELVESLSQLSQTAKMSKCE
ncbi:C8orf82 [Cordylochernes scorpioides]|uniref:C8orf82 n=1 Tax=Cordylochernes scorpioides TaxID=51811 RepID=A0ABY6LJ70_9ARAC|nr:C8orf82 [Cordylochernes scorpioides]